MQFVNFINFIKNSFVYKRSVMPEEQKGQTLHFGGKSSSPANKFPYFERTTLRSSAQYLQQEEKESVTTRHTVINNSEGTPTPLTVRIPANASKKKEGTGKKPNADSRVFLFDFIIETENLGPVLLRFEGEGRLYYCSLYAESDEMAAYLCQDFEEIRLLLESFLQKTRLGVSFLSLKNSLGKEHFIIDTRV